MCLDGGSGTTPQAAKYLVYRLPDESALIGIECKFCDPHGIMMLNVPLVRCDMPRGIRKRFPCRSSELSMQFS
jgi:hypothetical protein